MKRLILILCTGCWNLSVIGDPPEAICPDTPTTQIYYGTENPKYVSLSFYETLAVGTWYWCSGVLISPSWVLTAKHCGIEEGDFFCTGIAADYPNNCTAAKRVINNIDVDLTLVELVSSYDEAQHIRVLEERMDASWLCRIAEAAGYGYQENGNYGERKFVAEPIVALTEKFAVINGYGVSGACYGDSGGPLLVMSKDGSVRVAGSLSAGDADCLGRDMYTRTDLVSEWIQGHLNP